MNWLIKFSLILIVISLVVFLAVRTIDKDNDLINNLIKNNKADHNTNEQGEEKERILIIDGYKAIILDENVAEASGLKYETAESISMRPEFMAHAEVIDVKPLVSLKGDHQLLLVDRKTLQDELYNHNKILERAEALYKVKSLSTRELEKIHHERDKKASELIAIDTRMNSFVNKIKSSWGEAIANLLLHEQQEMFDEVTSYRKALVLLSLPKSKSMVPQNQTVFVSILNKRKRAQKMFYLDQAKEVNNPLYGESYFYLLESQRVRVGMRLFAWIEEGGNISEGHFITDRAVIWYANEPWIYIKHGQKSFIRKSLAMAKKIDNGWLLEDKMLVGDDLVVVEGGQTLLSEEFKWAIPDENDD